MYRNIFWRLYRVCGIKTTTHITTKYRSIALPYCLVPYFSDNSIKIAPLLSSWHPVGVYGISKRNYVYPIKTRINFFSSNIVSIVSLWFRVVMAKSKTTTVSECKAYLSHGILETIKAPSNQFAACVKWSVFL